jgi:curli biogenesis system outer membrane secretion channel CsgG
MKRNYITAFIVFYVFLILGCAGGVATSFIYSDFNFGQVERVAIVPFENLSLEQGTGNYVSRVFMTELLATNTFDIVEPGEVTKVLATQGLVKAAELNLDQIKKIASDLKVQAIILGSVGESTPLRTGTLNSHLISIDIRMVDVETGTTVWSSNVNTTGPGFFSRLFGTGDQTRGESVRKAVRKAIHSLVK